MSKLAPCGTRTAYKRHLRWGEDPCDECREASRIENQKYRPQYNEKRRERRRQEGKAQRAPKTRRELPVELPEVVPGPEGMGPCVMPENGFIWDPKRDGETPAEARKRQRVARAICVTSCPVFAWCQESSVAQGGVVAGAIK